MIRAEKQALALEAINVVIVYARMMAGARAPYDDLIAVLDVAEYLPSLFLEAEDRTEYFREVLFEGASKWPAFRAALARFDKDPGDAAAPVSLPDRR